MSSHYSDFRIYSLDYCVGDCVGVLTRGLATLPQGNQEPLMVTDKDGRPQVRCGEQDHGM